MSRKLILVTTILSFTIFFAIYTDLQYFDDLSNQPMISKAQFVRLTEDNAQTTSQITLPQSDYNKLIDIFFEFKLLPLVCRESSPFLLILIHSAPQNFQKRAAIRDTWGRKNKEIKLLFMLGSIDSEETELKVELERESQTTSDIVEGSFIDSYKNLTYKHVMTLKYAIYHCSTAKYVLKADDDIFVDTPSLLNYLETNISAHGAEKLLMCNIWDHATVRRSYRSKYRFSFKEYSQRTFPTYCSGWFVLYSPDVILDLYVQAQNSTYSYFWIDDVYVTGILADNLKIPHFNIRSFVISKDRMTEISNGLCDGNREDFMLGRPNIDAITIRKLWNCVKGA